MDTSNDLRDGQDARLDTLAKRIEQQLKEREFCIVFEDEIEHCWPGGKIEPTERESQIQAFARSRGWNAFILDTHSGHTRAVFCMAEWQRGLAMIHLATKYLLASAMVSGCSVTFILRAIKTAKDRRDSKRIYVFLCRNFENGQYRFQTSEAISVVTNLPVSRIAKLCGKHPHIEKKEYERHAWRVGNSVDETARKERKQTQ